MTDRSGPWRIAMLGDSLTAGYGLHPSEALPVRLQSELALRDLSSKITNAGVSGDTTADGLRRLDRSVPAGTELCIVALGANDMMQGVPVDRVEKNLDEIVARLKAETIAVLLCGMRAPPWYGGYALAFDRIYPRVARRHDVALHPFLLEGVALHPSYVLPDRIHPNAKGVSLIARSLAASVGNVLNRL